MKHDLNSLDIEVYPIAMKMDVGEYMIRPHIQL